MKAVPVLLLISLANGERSIWAPKEKLYENVGPPPRPLPVFLSPFVSDGLTEPVNGLKAPVDLLAMSMVLPKTEKARRQLLKTMPLSNIQFIEQPTAPPVFYDPREKMAGAIENGTKETQERMWFNYEAIQDMNLNRREDHKEPRYRYQSFRSKQELEREEARTRQKLRENSIMISKRNSTVNWTTCDQFKKRASFHPKDLLDVNWLPFYTWSDMSIKVAVIHTFSSAPRKMVVRMKQELGIRLTHAVDWNQHKVVMQNFEKTLLIAADQTGLFYGIKDMPIPEYFKRNTLLKFPVLTTRFKFVNQHLAMMDCDSYYATIMAPIEEAPKTDADKEKAARALNFTGVGQPVSRDLDQERRDDEAKKKYQRTQDEAKFIDFKDYVVEKDRHLDLWS